MTLCDHRQTQFSVKWDKPAAVRHRNIKKTNWEVYEAELDANIGLWFSIFAHCYSIDFRLENKYYDPTKGELLHCLYGYKYLHLMCQYAQILSHPYSILRRHLKLHRKSSHS